MLNTATEEADLAFGDDDAKLVTAPLFEGQPVRAAVPTVSVTQALGEDEQLERFRAIAECGCPPPAPCKAAPCAAPTPCPCPKVDKVSRHSTPTAVTESGCP